MNAVISPCGQYRYKLTRVIDETKFKDVLFIMLNPSTADDQVDDATIRRCIHFAKREGCRNMTVVNLFALRSSNPKDLEYADDPFGVDNYQHLDDEIRSHSINDLIICAWGANKFAKKKAQLPDMSIAQMFCLEMNRDGSPSHPLYIPNDAPLQQYRHWQVSKR